LKTPQKRKSLIAALGALFTLPAWANDVASPSPVTANISIVNNYVYRGLSRTNGSPAVQGGVDFAAQNGFYAGAWGSNISWLADANIAKGSSLELDVYAGVKNSFFTDFIYDFGIMRYHYPAVYNPGQGNADTDELHAALGYQWLILKYSYSLGNAFAIADSKGSGYTDLSANYPISDTGVTLGAHYGRQSFRGTGAAALVAAGLTPSYDDYNVSISKDLSGYVFGVAYSGTTAKDGGYYTNFQGNNLGRKGAIFSMRRTF